MTVPDEPDSSASRARQPMRDLLLAQALDACIAAERQLPGSSEEIIARQPVWARRELQRLVGLAGSLDAATSNAFMSDEFRVKARERLMRAIGGDQNASRAAVSPWAQAALRAKEPGAAVQPPRLTAVPALPVPVPGKPARDMRGSAPSGSKRRSRWLWRIAAGLLAAALGVVATLTASANALPGEPLYSVKQAQEDLEVRLATDDQARSMTLLRLADNRLAETSRLLQLGRTGQIAETTRRYDDVVEQATAGYAVIVDASPVEAPAMAHVETRLSQQQAQLEALLQSAPEQTRLDLRDALVATERGRALVADARPGEHVDDGAQIAAAVPTPAVALPVTAAEAKALPGPTTVPTPVPTVIAPTPVPVPEAEAPVTATDEPTTVPLVAQADESSDSHGSDIAVDDSTDNAVVAESSGGGSGTAGGSGEQQPVASSDTSGPDRPVRSEPAAVTAAAVAVAVAVATEDDPQTNGDQSNGQTSTGGDEVVRNSMAELVVDASAVTAASRHGSGGGGSETVHTVETGQHGGDGTSLQGGWDRGDPSLQVNARGSMTPLVSVAENQDGDPHPEAAQNQPDTTRPSNTVQPQRVVTPQGLAAGPAPTAVASAVATMLPARAVAAVAAATDAATGAARVIVPLVVTLPDRASGGHDGGNGGTGNGTGGQSHRGSSTSTSGAARTSTSAATVKPPSAPAAVVAPHHDATNTNTASRNGSGQNGNTSSPPPRNGGDAPASKKAAGRSGSKR